MAGEADDHGRTVQKVETDTVSRAEVETDSNSTLYCSWKPLSFG